MGQNGELQNRYFCGYLIFDGDVRAVQLGIRESFQQIMLEALVIYSYGRMNLAPTLYHSKQCQIDHSSHLKTKTLKLVEKIILVI